MALNLSDKLQRILTFLVGARNPRVFAVLATRGFTQNDLNDGWELFSVAAGARLKYRGPVGSPLSPDVAREHLARLDEWENTWFPVVSATLERHYPEIHEKIFANLSQTEGPEVLVSVGTLLARLTEMKQDNQWKKADELLASRGLTKQERDAAASIIAALKKIDKPALPEVDPQTAAEQQKAIEQAWAWYREWSQIARTLISRGDVLIRLGLRQPSRSSGGEEDEGEPGGGEPQPAA